MGHVSARPKGRRVCQATAGTQAKKEGSQTLGGRWTVLVVLTGVVGLMASVGWVAMQSVLNPDAELLAAPMPGPDPHGGNRSGFSPKIREALPYASKHKSRQEGKEGRSWLRRLHPVSEIQGVHQAAQWQKLQQRLGCRNTEIQNKEEEESRSAGVGKTNNTSGTGGGEGLTCSSTGLESAQSDCEK